MFAWALDSEFVEHDRGGPDFFSGSALRTLRPGMFGTSRKAALTLGADQSLGCCWMPVVLRCCPSPGQRGGGSTEADSGCHRFWN